ncbi:MAG: cytochrome c3 family protein [Acidobacteria bacterium]|nr:cytochrome c3 family protein [Acidobacteriota bacterium]
MADKQAPRDSLTSSHGTQPDDDDRARRGGRHGGAGWVAAAALAVVWLASVTSSVSQSSSRTGQSSQRGSDQAAPPAVFTPAHRNVADAVRDFLGVRPAAVQPIAFPHNVHIANRLGCTDYCHAGAAVGPVAGLPSVRTCMICHGSIATDRPEVKKVAAYLDRGEDISWQRVYGYPRSAHVRFNHAPHVRAGVECATCHGDVAHRTVATRSTDLTMGTCVGCHRAKNAPVDCLTCHF